MTSILNRTGQRSVWRHGKTASFGLWTRSLTGSRLLILLYKGVVFKRTTTAIYTLSSGETGGTGATGGSGETGGTGATGGSGETGGTVTLEFKQKIVPELTVVPACGAIIPFSDFPIIVSLSEGKVVYSGDDLKTFRSFGSIDDARFYALKDAQAPQDFELPDIDEAVYSSDDGVEETKRGLLMPLLRIDARVSPSGSVFVKDVLDIRTFDELRFEPVTESTPEEEEVVCGEDGEDGADASDGVTGGGDVGGREGGQEGGAYMDESADTEKLKPCPGETGNED